MNLINLLGNTVWTDREIAEHTEALVHQVTPVMEEMVLNRKLTAAAMGQWVMTPDEQAELATYSQACMAAHAVGIEMRADNEKLKAVLSYEAALARLALPVIDDLPDVTDQDGNTSPNPGLAVDIVEREAAQAVVDNASDETLALYELRKPPVPEVLPEPEPVTVPEVPTDGQDILS